MTELERIESKLDEILHLLGKDRGRSVADIRRQAEATVIRLQSRGKNRKRGYVSEIGKQ